ncbi:MAG: hypothetical protein AB7K71_15890 [Polyangiaceae bacterium]
MFARRSLLTRLSHWPARRSRGSQVWGLGVLGALALASAHCSSPPPQAPQASASSASSANDTPAPSPSGSPTDPDVEAAQAEAPAVCSDECKALLSAADVIAKKVTGLAGTDGEAAFAAKATTAAEVAWRGCLLSQPHGPDVVCEGSAALVPSWVAQAKLAKDPDAELYAQLVLRDPRWRPEGATIDDTRLQALIKDAKNPALVLAALVVLRDPRKVWAYSGSMKATDALAISARIGASSYFNDSDMPREALGVLPAARPKDPGLALAWAAQTARTYFAAGDLAMAMQEAEEVIQAWDALDGPAKAKALMRKEPYPLIGREAVVGAVGAAMYLQAEKLRLEAEKLKAPSTASLKSSDQLQDYYKKFQSWSKERHAALEDATRAYVDITQVKPVFPARWVVEGMRRVGEMWRDFDAEMNGIKFPAAIEKDTTSVANLRKAIAESSAPLKERAKKSFSVCANTGTRERVAKDAVEVCEKNR